VSPADHLRFVVCSDGLVQVSKKIDEQVNDLQEFTSESQPYGRCNLIVSALRELKISASGLACAFGHRLLNRHMHILGLRGLGYTSDSCERSQEFAHVLSRDDPSSSEHYDVCLIDLDHRFEEMLVGFEAGDESLSLFLGGAES